MSIGKIFRKEFWCFVLTCLPLITIWSCVHAQDTFSIVAVDSLTGEVGSAGASCIGGSIIISKLYPDRGAIHTQAAYISSNQGNAQIMFNAGLSPQALMDWLQDNDAQFDASVRQYGAVDFDINGSPRAAAFTGVNCFDYKNHIVGPNYAIQGNILLGQAILDSMEARFVNTNGTLAEKLMASLQGANVPGADTRCLEEGVSSQSAFIRVAKPSDTEDNYFLDLNIPSTLFGVEPIDSLQTLFDEWYNINVGVINNNVEQQTYALHNFPNPFTEQTQLTIPAELVNKSWKLTIFNTKGQLISQLKDQSPIITITKEHLSNQSGVYYYKLIIANKYLFSGNFILVN